MTQSKTGSALFLTMCAAVLLILAGCERKVETDPSPIATTPTADVNKATTARVPVDEISGKATVTESRPDPDPANITVCVVDGDGFRAVLEKHRGKVVLVDFWADW